MGKVSGKTHTKAQLDHWAKVPSRFMRKFICRLRLNEVSRQ